MHTEEEIAERRARVAATAQSRREASAARAAAKRIFEADLAEEFEAFLAEGGTAEEFAALHVDSPAARAERAAKLAEWRHRTVVTLGHVTAADIAAMDLVPIGALVIRASGPRPRGAGRPRARAHAARSSAKSGDSGEDGPGEPAEEPPATRHREGDA